MSELSIIQKTYDLVKWYIPILNRLPRSHKFTLGERMITGLYEFLEGLIVVQYSSKKFAQLKTLNGKLDVLRYQTRLLVDFGLMDEKRYAYVTQLLVEIGNELGGWIKQQNQREQR
ncbi:MAG: diversity-generating retroelement protein Avd [Phormidium sp. BM_Day4_Bin.17]|nr:diversity-generating retroelement protein Avd [Phormidium sp. BM_Day4_Bin.17]UCJ12787.1 MAG: diversity-generating retroelement protein Avd [Phormidium sp. PBR-2020]